MKLKKFRNYFQGLNAGVLTNQSAFGKWPNRQNQYHFQALSQDVNVVRVFVPEHGLFAELQDQVSGSGLEYHFPGTEFVNLYGDDEKSLVPSPEKLKGLDLIIIDIRDVGSRYYTFLTSAKYLLQAVFDFNREFQKNIEIVVVDSPNPIGGEVEGSPLQEKYASFVGETGVLHRHGLSPFELLEYYNVQNRWNLSLHPLKGIYDEVDKSKEWIPPSPNIPTIQTCLVYVGQCLLEGTNLSEGRGTTKPFEIFGADYIQPFDEKLLQRIYEPFQTPKFRNCFSLRPLKFQPTSHKFANTTIGGFQILVHDKQAYPSLFFTLHLLRSIQEFYPKQFSFLNGPYEFRSDKQAIELLVGDDFLLSYLFGKTNPKEILDYLLECKIAWNQKLRSR